MTEPERSLNFPEASTNYPEGVSPVPQPRDPHHDKNVEMPIVGPVVDQQEEMQVDGSPVDERAARRALRLARIVSSAAGPAVRRILETPPFDPTIPDYPNLPAKEDDPRAA